MIRNLPGLLAVLAAASLLTACGASSPSELRVQGNVSNELDVVTVPVLAVPAVNLDAGFKAVAPGNTDPTQISLGSSRAGTAVSLGSYATVAAVNVREGESVTAGQALVQLDDRLLRAALRAAQADAAVAHTQRKLIDAATKKVDDAKQELADKRVDLNDVLAKLKKTQSDVNQAIRKLTATRKTLVAKLAEVEAGKAKLTGAITQLEQALAALPPNAPNRPAREAQLQALQTQLAQVNAAQTKLTAGLSQLDAGLAKARAGRTKLNQGLTKAKDGRRKLDDAASTVADKRGELDRLSRLAKIAADAADIPVELARVQLAEAAVTAPSSGVIVSVANLGAQLAPGATLVRIRPDLPAKVTTWLSPAQADQLCVGDPAQVSGDWAAEAAAATVTRIAPAAEFPPSSQATEEVHLTRAFLVELTTQTDLPAGAPVTISIQSCRATASDHSGR